MPCCSGMNGRRHGECYSRSSCWRDRCTDRHISDQVNQKTDRQRNSKTEKNREKDDWNRKFCIKTDLHVSVEIK